MREFFDKSQFPYISGKFQQRNNNCYDPRFVFMSQFPYISGKFQPFSNFNWTDEKNNSRNSLISRESFNNYKTLLLAIALVESVAIPLYLGKVSTLRVLQRPKRGVAVAIPLYLGKVSTFKRKN